MSRVGQTTFRGLLLLAALLLVGVATWLCVPGQRAPIGRAEPEVAYRPARAPAPKFAPITSPQPEAASDGVPIMPARADEALPAGPVHPHPITAQHARIFEENRLIGALNGAVDMGDAAGLRRLLAQYRADYPEDGQDAQGGYQAIADCLERPGADSRAAAQRWSDEHRGSTVRRFVARTCRLDGAIQ